MAEPRANPDERASLLRAAAAVTAVLAVVILAGGAVEWLLDWRPRPPLEEGGAEALVPLPPGGEEVAFQSGREGVTLHYSAPGRVGEVMQFYRVAMVERGWRLLDLEEAADDDGLMAFARPGETCIMRISETAPGGPAAITAVLVSPAAPPFGAPYEETEP